MKLLETIRESIIEHLNIKGEDIGIHSPNVVSIRAYGTNGEHLQGGDSSNQVISVQIMTTGATYSSTYDTCERIHRMLIDTPMSDVEFVKCQSSPLVIGRDKSGWQCVANYTIYYFKHGGI